MLSLHQIVVSLCVSCQVMAVVISRSLGMVLPHASIFGRGKRGPGWNQIIQSMGIFNIDTNIMLL